MNDKNNIKLLGSYLTLDLYHCSAKATGSLEKCYSYLDGMPKILGNKKLSPPFIVSTDGEKYPDKAGLSGWIPVIDPRYKIFSGISIHTLTPTNFISIDIFSFRKINLEKIKKFTRGIFKPKKIKEKIIVRGNP